MNQIEIIELDAEQQCENHDLVTVAYEILNTCRETCVHLSNAHCTCSVGDKEDCLDILRAMFITSCAGFDAAIKATIEYALKDSSWYTFESERNKPLKKAYQKWMQEFLFKECNEDVRSSRLTNVLMSGPDCYVHDFINERLSKGSLLNKGKIKFINECLLGSTLSEEQIDGYSSLFNMRHVIVHNLDFDIKEAKRITRTASDLVGATNQVLELAETILKTVDIGICETTDSSDDTAHDIEQDYMALLFLRSEEKIQFFKDDPDAYEQAKLRFGLN